MSNITWNFKDKVVVITGAATGIGRGTAFEFAKAGAKIAVCDFNADEGTKTAKKCEELGTVAKFYRMDVSSVEEIEAAKDAILADFGTVDILFSNAGISSKFMGPPLDIIPDSDWERTYTINTLGMVRVCRAFIPTMKEKKSGKIVLTSSMSMHLPNPNTMPYSASKVATANFGQALSIEMGAYNVNVNILCPGFVYTEIFADGTGLRYRDKRGGALAQFNDNESVMNAMAAGSSLGRPQTVVDMANAVMFLCSDEASEITGQIVNVDSGMIRRY